MITCNGLWEIFKKNDLTFFTGVPDSTFKDWMSFLQDEKELTNVIACNECEAIALSSGYYLATKKIPIVYMQNSGLGKTVNPITSLASKEVYSIPMILMIGWRGQPGKKDEPQHKMMGRIMLSLLDVLEIPYKLLPKEINEAEKIIFEMKKLAEENKSPVAIIIEEGTLEEYHSTIEVKTGYEMKREDAIKTILENIEKEVVIISTTGKTSRELYEQRILRQEIPRDFLTVGSMGCSSSIAVEIAIEKPEKKVFCFDGDGAVLMQMGALSTIGSCKPKNFNHIIFDNASHDSTGGQPTNSKNVNFEQIAIACGYNRARTVLTKQDLIDSIEEIRNIDGPNMIIVKVNKGARKDLGRPTSTPIENKEIFMKFLEE